MINKRRNLRSGTTFWQARTPRVPLRSSPDLAPFYDVVIIGAGISGALVADAISNGQRSVLVVDRRSPAAGSTSASTALIQWEVDVPLGELSRKIGKARAVKAYRATRKAVTELHAFVTRNKLQCDMIKRDTLLIAGTEMSGRALRSETALRQKAGLPSRYLDAEALAKRYGFDREGAILSSGSLEIDPRKLTFELLRKAQRNGCHIHFPDAVTRMEHTSAGVFLTFGSGLKVAASKVIAATGYEALPDVPKSNYDLISTWALATKPVAPEKLWNGKALVWEASDPYLYFRTTVDHRVIVGGEDMAFNNPEKRDRLTKTKVKRIISKLQKLLPDVKLVPEYTWAGTFAESSTGLPSIGPLPGQPNVFALLGAGGNGITYSVIARAMALRWLHDRKEPLAKVFGL
jgi:glycine/D-amino acid oxidase-like deaminating enzyme